MNIKSSTPREPLSAYTHMAGAILSVFGTIYIAVIWGLKPEISLKSAISALGFGLSLIALYMASTIYHWNNGSAKQIAILRKLDHSMIYVLIAGTYTPMLLNFLPAPKGMIFTITMWGVAALGIAIKLFWFGAPRLLSTVLYILMGWAILFDTTAITSMDFGGAVLLALGGISYTVGAVIYAIKKPNWFKSFGFHELFHVFVLIGSLFHYLVVVIYIL